MKESRRNFLKELGVASTALLLPSGLTAESVAAGGRSHLVTLSFDDGFKKSFLRTAEIYEKRKLSACLNVVAAGLPEDAYIQKSPLGELGFGMSCGRGVTK